jgi:hypothetical protein
LGKGSATTTNQTTTAPNAQAGAAYSQLLNQAGNVAATPYQAYTGELTAPVNSQQQAGISGINQNANFAQPVVNQAIGIAGQAANPLTQAQIQQYQNPYTQDVVNATQNEFNNQNAQQQAGVTGNAISQGALGGNRVGVAQSNLANQQQLAQAPVIAGLYNQSYQQGLQTAGQQFQQNPLAAASSLANFGISGQGAALSGAGAQLGAGTLQQQTQQAQDTANYGQYAQAQAYPFQTTQWLAGLDTGVGSQLGGTSSGQTTAPPPNQTAQDLGLGIAAAGLFLNRGGRVGYANGGVVPQHMDSGGISGTPWSQGVGWIPSLSIHGGPGAPHASAPGVAAQPAFDPTKFANQIVGLGGGKGSGSNIGNEIGAAFNPEAYGASDTGISGAGAYGGSSSNPAASWMDAGDYGEGFKRGGVAGYADGGAPDFSDRFDPAVEQPFGDMPRAEALGLAGLGSSRGIAPQPGGGVTYDDGQGPIRINPGNRPVGDATALKGTGVAPSDDAEVETPEEATATNGRATSSGDTSGAGPATFKAPYQIGPADYAPPARDTGSGFGLGWLSPNAKTGLLSAGLGMLANRSPFLGTAVGEGGLTGLAAYGSAEERDRKAAQDAQKLSLEAKQSANELAEKTFSLNETSRHNKAVEEKEFKPTWGVISEAVDPDTGLSRKTYGWIDPNKKAITDASGKPIVASTSPAPTSQPPQLGSDGKPVTGEEWAKTVSPQRADRARMLSNYEETPADLPTRGGVRATAVADAKHFNSDYNEQNYAASQRAYNNFVAGPEARSVRSLNVATDHLDTLRDAATALKNGQLPVLNSIVNHFREATGSPLTTNFDSIKQAVSSEIAKVVVGGQTALADRDEMANRARNADSPEQLYGIFDQFTKLMGGQMKGLKQQYETGTYRKDFEKFLLPSTKKSLASVSKDVEPSWEKPNFAPPAGAIPQTHNGKTYYYDPQTKQPYPGQ